MLKKTLIATAALSATLLAAATLLPALAQSRSTAPAGTAATSAQAPVDAGPPDQRAAADDSSARTGTRQSERGQDRRKAEISERDDRNSDEGRGGSIGTTMEKEKRKARD
jgi:hypothetical protein